MSLAGWAETRRIYSQSAFRWLRAGTLAVPAVRVGGLIMVGDLSDAGRAPNAKAAVYVRVSDLQK